MMSYSSGWVDNVFMDPRGVKNANGKNSTIALITVSKLILARWVVFNTFIQVANELELEGDTIKHDWLIFQILPLVRINGTDPFEALINVALGNVDFEMLLCLRAPLNPSSVLGSSFNSKADSFFYVIDEAQVAGEQYMGAFADRDGSTKRPVLYPIIQYIMEWERDIIKVIVSGTGFSLDLFKPIMKTWGVGKDRPKMFDVIHTTGDFSDPDIQFRYISRYLPPAFLASDSGAHLTTRVYDWLRGRYVLTKVSRR